MNLLTQMAVNPSAGARSWTAVKLVVVKNISEATRKQLVALGYVVIIVHS